METKTMGSFMAALRKANGLTQQQVADLLNVSNKTVSKWECNEGYPEITMLPAIAELYSVTVDELLRGQRITNAACISPAKSDERIKHLIHKASIKFTNSAIVSIILGIVAVILTYSMGNIFVNYNLLWIGYIIILLLCGTSLAVGLVGMNSFVARLDNEDIVNKELLGEKTAQCIKYVSVTIFLVCVAIPGIIINIAMDNPSNMFIFLPVTALVGGGIAGGIGKLLGKKFHCPVAEITEEQKRLKERFVKGTATIVACTMVIAVATPFVSVFLDTLSPNAYCFAEGVGYQYDTMSEAETEYHKVKDIVAKGKYFYTNPYTDYDEKTGTYTVGGNKAHYTFIQGKKGLELESWDDNITYEEKTFNTEAEYNKFIDECTFDDMNVIYQLKHDVVFDDETLTVYYKDNNGYITRVMDILPMFAIIGCTVSVVIIPISALIYNKKFKALAAGKK
ncbi:MAG: helix-turn-helix domain-containing protein [Eubacterium sp.]